MFYETSAKTAYNVEKAFLSTTSTISENIESGLYDMGNDQIGIKPGNDMQHLENQSYMNKNDRRGSNLNKHQIIKEKKSSCC